MQKLIKCQIFCQLKLKEIKMSIDQKEINKAAIFLSLKYNEVVVFKLEKHCHNMGISHK